MNTTNPQHISDIFFRLTSTGFDTMLDLTERVDATGKWVLPYPEHDEGIDELVRLDLISVSSEPIDHKPILSGEQTVAEGCMGATTRPVWGKRIRFTTTGRDYITFEGLVDN